MRFQPSRLFISLTTLWIGSIICLTLLQVYFSSSTTTPSPHLSNPTPTLTPPPTLTPTPTPTAIPVQTILTGGTHTFQTFNNCGPASLSMALSYYDITQTQSQLGQALRPYQHPTGDNDDKSVTLSELASIASEYQLTAYHRPAGTIQILNQLNALGLPVITRTWLKPNDYIGHYRLVTGYDQSTATLIQDDSLQGRQLTYTNEQFIDLWKAFNYEFLVLVPPHQVAQVETILGSLTQHRTAWQTALTLSQQQLTSNPDDIFAAFNASVAHYQLGNYAESISNYEHVKTQLPFRMLWYQLDPLLAYYKIGRYNEVLTLSDSILSYHNRAYAELYQLKSLIYESQNLPELAQQNADLAHFYNSSSHWQVNLR